MAKRTEYPSIALGDLPAIDIDGDGGAGGDAATTAALLSFYDRGGAVVNLDIDQARAAVRDQGSELPETGRAVVTLAALYALYPDRPRPSVRRLVQERGGERVGPGEWSVPIRVVWPETDRPGGWARARDGSTGAAW